MKFWTIFKWFLLTVLSSGLLVMIALSIYVYQLSTDLPSLDQLEDYQFELPTQVFDNRGNLASEFYIHHRVLLSAEQIPENVKFAVIAVEDSRFYQHQGIDLIRITKAFWVNLIAGRIVEGASTITQQTAKQFLLSSEKKYERKLREILLAMRMERRFSKDKILELYLNKAYFGRRANGIEAAAQTYFAKSTQDLNIEEAALLAGLLKAPSHLSPTRNKKQALQRRNLVLGLMAKNQFITQEEWQVATNTPIKLNLNYRRKARQYSTYYIEEVRRLLTEILSETDLSTAGFRVYTAMNSEYQTAAQNALSEGLLALDKRHGYRGPKGNILKDIQLDNTLLTQVDSADSPELATQEQPIYSFLDQQKLAKITKLNELEEKSIVQGVVVSVSADQAEVALGLREAGLLPLRLMRWAVPASFYDQTQNPLKSASRVLKVGDWIAVKIVEVPNIDDPTSAGFYTLALHQVPEHNGGFIALDPKTGHVLAVSGGIDFGASQFNRATQSLRQPGSAFKPIVYAAALDNGFTPASVLEDTPLVFADLSSQYQWFPKNYSGRFSGSLTVRQALAKSKNVSTVRLLMQIGLSRLFKTIKQLGLDTSQFPHDFSIALGSASVKLIDLVKAYTVFANGGQLVKPIFITRIEDRQGNVLYRNEPEFTASLEPSTAFLMGSLLREVVQTGTGWRARAIGRPSAGKTGTTDNNSDAWYIGYTPQLIAGVYVGNDTPAISLGVSETGSKAAAPVWVDFMKSAVHGLPTEPFRQPKGITRLKIATKSGLLACDASVEQRFEYFKLGSGPSRCHRSDLTENNFSTTAGQAAEWEDDEL